MWKINEQFLQQQMDQRYILTHDPNTATGSYAKEIEFLKRKDYKKFVKSGPYWRAIKIK